MLHLVSDVRSRQIIIKSFRVVVYHYFLLDLALILPLYELLLELIDCEGLDKGIEFFFLVIPRRPPRIDENLWTNDSCQNFRFFPVPLMNVNHNQQMEVVALVIVSCG